MTLRALVGVKRVIDYAAKVYVQPDKKGVCLDGQKFSMNPFCEIAVEAAVRLKEQKILSDILAVSVGCDRAREQLQVALALGADRAMLIKTSLRADQLLQPLAVAKLFKCLVESEKPDIVILGKQAIDSDSNQMGQLLAGLLGWPQVSFCSGLEVESSGKDPRLVATREIDKGLQQVQVPLPAVITCDLRLNQPRYVTLPCMLKARKKPIAIQNAEDFGVDVNPQTEIIRVEEPRLRKRGVQLSSPGELVAKLKEAGLIPHK